MKEQSVKRNMIYQGLYQFLMLGVPLITSPYLTRTLGAEKLGIYTYVNSIAYYFVIFANLGISRHGQRVIAAASEDVNKLRKTFYGLLLDHSVFSMVSLLLYSVFISLNSGSNELVFRIQGLYVLSALFDVTWLFYGLENFGSVVIKNTIIKLAELVCIFAFVHDANDITIYTWIMSASILVGQFIMIPQMLSIVKPIKINRDDCLVHIKPLLVLSISVVAVSLYTVFDKTLIGLMLNMESVSYYECANRIISVPKSLLGVVATVLFPRVCKLATDNNEKLKRFFVISFYFTGVVGIGFTFLVIAISKSFAPLYYGNDFVVTGTVMIAMAPVVIIVALGDLIRTQLMIPKHKDVQFILCVVFNAIVNIVLSVLLIPVIGIFGAVIGSVMAEICGMVLETLYSRSDISIRATYLELIPFIFIGGVSILPATILQAVMGISWKTFFMQGICVSMLYFGISILYIFKFKKEYFYIIQKKIRK